MASTGVWPKDGDGGGRLEGKATSRFAGREGDLVRRSADALVVPRKAIPTDDAHNVGEGDFTIAAWIHPGKLEERGIVSLGNADRSLGWFLDTTESTRRSAVSDRGRGPAGERDRVEPARTRFARKRGSTSPWWCGAAETTRAFTSTAPWRRARRRARRSSTTQMPTCESDTFRARACFRATLPTCGCTAGRWRRPRFRPGGAGKAVRAAAPPANAADARVTLQLGEPAIHRRAAARVPGGAAGRRAARRERQNTGVRAIWNGSC